MAGTAKAKLKFEDLKKKPRVSEVVPVCMDEEAAREYDQISQEVEDLKLRMARRRIRTSDAENEIDQKKLDELVARQKEAEKKRNEHLIHIVVSSIGRKAFEDLLRAHPPVDEDHKELRESLGKPEDDESIKSPFHGDTFVPALIAAAATEPEMTVDQAQELYDDWNQAEIDNLFQACYRVNTQRRVVEMGKSPG